MRGLYVVYAPVSWNKFSQWMTDSSNLTQFLDFLLRFLDYLSEK